MIEFSSNNAPKTTRPVKAVGLISGGLDSALAAQVVKDLGVEVQGVYFAMPWGCCDKDKAMSAAEKIGIPCVVLQLDERYLEVVRKPKHGYGTALNPCVDCRIHMFSRAAQYMRSIGADFIFTGEVLGQRPMSQQRHSMRAIEKESDLEGRLLRPLCAQLLDPTIPEQEGLIDRQKLLKLSGRSRQPQIEMAKEFGITDYLQPAGGCLLTDQNFARKMKDTFKHGYRSFRETISLKWGRHLRISPEFKVIIGRDQPENEALNSYAHEDDLIFEFEDKQGPTVLLKGYNPSPQILELAAGLVQKYSLHKNATPREVDYWPANQRNEIRKILPRIPNDEEIEKMKI